jgi:hypothetical protein
VGGDGGGGAGGRQGLQLIAVGATPTHHWCPHPCCCWSGSPDASLLSPRVDTISLEKEREYTYLQMVRGECYDAHVHPTPAGRPQQ